MDESDLEGLAFPSCSSREARFGPFQFRPFRSSHKGEENLEEKFEEEFLTRG
jgi:hypothetical protein